MDTPNSIVYTSTRGNGRAEIRRDSEKGKERGMGVVLGGDDLWVDDGLAVSPMRTGFICACGFCPGRMEHWEPRTSSISADFAPEEG